MSATRNIFLVALAAVVTFTAGFRFLALESGFSNDHFVHLAGAQQMLAGEWPTRDFQDPGLPLMYALSAAADALIGPTLFAEAVLVSLAFAIAALLTAAAVRELTGSYLLALLAAVIEVVIFPRTYGYPKVLLYAAAFLLIQRYVARPDRRHLIALGICAAVAFGFRHDHGIYLMIGGVLAALLTPDVRVADRIMRAAIVAAITAIGIAPYLLYVELHSGLWTYLRTGVEFSVREAGRQWHVWPSPMDDGLRASALVYLFHALPVVALGVVAIGWRRADAWGQAARIVPIAAVAIFVNISFIRDPLDTRLPDAIVPAVLLAAWLAHRACTARRARWLGVAALALVALVGIRAVVSVGNIVERLDASGLLVSWTRIPEFAGEVATALRTPLSPSQIPSDAGAHLLPFMQYLDRCTTRDHRLLMMGFLPEVPVLARRLFAGGQSTFIPGYYGSTENQQLVLERLRRQTVPFAVIPREYAGELEGSFPLVSAHVSSRYEPLASFGDDEDTAVDVLVDRLLPARGRDPETSWPCFRD